MSHHIERQAQRIAHDLNTGHLRDAANVIRQEINCDPREALTVIQMANRMRDQRSPDHIVVQNGNVYIRDEQHRTQTYAGHINISRLNYGRQDDCDQRNDDRGGNRRYNGNNGRQEDCDPRFPNRTNGGYYPDRSDGSYYPNRPYQTPPYVYNGRPDCDPRYDRPDIYRPDIYRPQQIYIPDCFGNQERRGMNAGTAALLLLGGVAIGRSIGNNHHGGARFSIRGW